MDLHLHIIGSLLILLALIHVAFPWYFNWRTELASLSVVNRQMMEVHSFFIGLTVLLMGVLCIVSAQALQATPLGRQIALGLCLFWTVRLIIQLFGYSSKLWKGRRFETGVHIVFTLFWLYMSVVFFLVSDVT